MRRLILLIAMVTGACGITVERTDQDNFAFHASDQQAARFINAVSKRFGAVPDIRALNVPDSDPSQLVELDETSATLMIVQQADDRCDVHAPVHATYHQGEYRIDLAYRSKSADKRQSAKGALIQAARDVGLTISKFEECR